MVSLTSLLFVFIGFIPHEIFLLSYFITYGIQNGITFPIFIFVFILTDLIAIPLTFLFYGLLYKKFLKHNKSWIAKKVNEGGSWLNNYLSGYNTIPVTILLGFIGNLWIASLIAAFSKMKMGKAFIGLMIGNLIFFIMIYSSVTGLSGFIPALQDNIILLVLTVFVVSMLIRYLVKKLVGSRKSLKVKS